MGRDDGMWGVPPFSPRSMVDRHDRPGTDFSHAQFTVSHFIPIARSTTRGWRRINSFQPSPIIFPFLSARVAGMSLDGECFWRNVVVLRVFQDFYGCFDLVNFFFRVLNYFFREYYLMKRVSIGFSLSRLITFSWKQYLKRGEKRKNDRPSIVIGVFRRRGGSRFQWS